MFCPLCPFKLEGRRLLGKINQIKYIPGQGLNFGHSGPGYRLFGLESDMMTLPGSTVAVSYSAVVIDGSANAFTELNSVQIHTSAVQVVKYSVRSVQ